MYNIVIPTLELFIKRYVNSSFHFIESKVFSDIAVIGCIDVPIILYGLLGGRESSSRQAMCSSEPQTTVRRGVTYNTLCLYLTNLSVYSVATHHPGGLALSPGRHCVSSSRDHIIICL